VLIGFTTFMNDRLVRRAPRLKWIQALGAGVDSIVDLPSLGHDVIVTNLRGIHGAAVSEAAIMLMLALARGLPRALRNQDAGRWERWPAALLDGKIAGILGVGTIAEALTPRLKALGMTVTGFTTAPRPVAGFDQMHRRDDLRQLAGTLDHLVVLLPLTAETRHWIAAEILVAMKPSAFLVNLGRGGVVDESALVAALRDGRIAGAALDVFEQEPLPAASPLWTLPNVIVTPHLGGKHDAYAARALPTIAENVRHFVAGDYAGMINIVKPGLAAARGERA